MPVWPNIFSCNIVCKAFWEDCSSWPAEAFMWGKAWAPFCYILSGVTFILMLAIPAQSHQVGAFPPSAFHPSPTPSRDGTHLYSLRCWLSSRLLVLASFFFSFPLRSLISEVKGVYSAYISKKYLLFKKNLHSNRDLDFKKRCSNGKRHWERSFPRFQKSLRGCWLSLFLIF